MVDKATIQLIRLAIAKEPSPVVQVSMCAMFELGAEDLMDPYFRESYVPGQKGSVGVPKLELTKVLDALDEPAVVAKKPTAKKPAAKPVAAKAK